MDFMYYSLEKLSSMNQYQVRQVIHLKFTSNFIIQNQKRIYERDYNYKVVEIKFQSNETIFVKVKVLHNWKEKNLYSQLSQIKHVNIVLKKLSNLPKSWWMNIY